MTDYSAIVVDEPLEHVVRVTLTRPDRANALSRQLFVELLDVLDGAERDRDARVLLFTGAPRPDGRPWFSAGADTKEPSGRDLDPETPPGRSILANAVLDRIEEMLTPSIAVIDGLCTTGGLELALACDLRIASETATLCDWHMKTFGVAIGGWGAATRMVRTVGLPKAKELLLTGTELTGTQACAIGLVNKAVPSDSLMDAALAWASTIAAMRPEGVRLTMGFLAVQQYMDTQEALRWARRMPDVMGIERTATQPTDGAAKD